MMVNLCMTHSDKNNLLTSITFSVAARDKAGALGAGTGITLWSEQTQMAAGSLTWILHCRDKGGGFDFFHFS